MTHIIIYILLGIIILLGAVIVELMLVSGSAKDRWYMEGYIDGSKNKAAEEEQNEKRTR